MSRPRHDWWGYAKGIIRRYEHGTVTSTEREAVDKAIAETLSMDCGTERVKVVELVFWRQTHTLAGAAMQIPVSYETAKKWHRDFLYLVAEKRGLLK